MSDLTLSSTVAATLDLEFLRTLLPDERDEAAEFVGSLEEIHDATTAECLESIRTASHAQDGESLGRAVHSLKGAGLSLGALGMVRVLRELEEVRSSTWDLVAGLIAELEHEARRVHEALVLLRQALAESSPR